MKLTRKLITSWTPIAVGILCITGLQYFLAQHLIRAELQQPQVELATNLAAGLAAGSTTISELGMRQIDASSSLSPFEAVYDSTGTLIGSSGMIAGTAPILPQSVFDRASKAGEYRFTWKATQRTRLAAVVVKSSNGSFALAARNMYEGEKLISEAFLMCVIATLILWIGSFAVVLLQTDSREKQLSLL